MTEVIRGQRSSYFLQSFLLRAARLVASRLVRIPARCRRDPAASFSSSSTSALASSHILFLGASTEAWAWPWPRAAGFGRRPGRPLAPLWSVPAFISSLPALGSWSESSLLWKPSLPARCVLRGVRPKPSSTEDRDEDLERDGRCCWGTLL